MGIDMFAIKQVKAETPNRYIIHNKQIPANIHKIHSEKTMQCGKISRRTATTYTHTHKQALKTEVVPRQSTMRARERVLMMNARTFLSVNKIAYGVCCVIRGARNLCFPHSLSLTQFAVVLS